MVKALLEMTAAPPGAQKPSPGDPGGTALMAGLASSAPPYKSAPPSGFPGQGNLPFAPSSSPGAEMDDEERHLREEIANEIRMMTALVAGKGAPPSRPPGSAGVASP